MSDYALNNITSEKTDFATYLRKNLQVGVSDNGDGTYSFLVGQWQVVLAKDKIISIEKFELDVDKIYPSVAVMKADTELVEGKLVQTESYWSSEYGGSAYYDIVDPTNLTADEGKYIQLDNGLIAQLHAINNTVTVNQFGAYGDGEHNDARAINLAFKSKFQNVTFESDNYKINSLIYISESDLAILGNNATIFYDDEINFGISDFVIQIYNYAETITRNVSILNLSLINKNTTREDEVLMLKIRYAENIDIYKCNIESYEVEGNTNRKVTNIDLREYWNNINIEECNLINTTNAPAGGTIWVRSGKEGTGDLTLKNNYIKKSCHDETIAIFGTGSGGTVENVNIESNIIDIDEENVELKSDVIINLGNNTDGIKNINFINNKLNVKAGRGFFDIKKATNVLIANNEMNLTSISGQDYITWFREYRDTSSNVEFSNNKIVLNNETGMKGYVFNGYDKVINNQIEVNMDFVYLFNECKEISNNKIVVNNDLNEGNYINIVNYVQENENFILANNMFDFTQVVNPGKEMRFVNFYNTTIGGYNVEIKNNIVKGQENQASQYYVYFQEMLDTEPQNIYIENNHFGFFSKLGRYKNSTTYNVIEK